MDAPFGKYVDPGVAVGGVGGGCGEGIGACRGIG